MFLVTLLMASLYQFTPYEVGQVKAHMHHKLTALQISRIVLKSDGKSHFSESAVAAQMVKLENDTCYTGVREEGSGAPRKTTAALDKKIVRCVFKHRGHKKVTVKFLRKRFPSLKKFSNDLVESRLHEAGLKWMRRRKKTLVSSKYKPERISYCQAVKRKHQDTLNKWAYSDGTTWYLDKTEGDNEHTKRRALGGYVWRKMDCSDAMYDENVGPSSYNKAQGYPVRAWGLLADGQLHLHILPEGEAMNRYKYASLVEKKFPDWLGNCKYLVQDFERCLRCVEPLAAMKTIGVELVQEYPRVSQDFNTIENIWKLLNDRLAETLPIRMEGRDDFLPRLRNAVEWLNRNRKAQMLSLSRNQKVRATDCLALGGARTKW